MSAMTDDAALADMSFEEAYARLEEVLERLQIGNLTLDESLDAYAEGTALALHCQALLDAAELRVETLERGAARGYDEGDENESDDDDDEPPF